MTHVDALIEQLPELPEWQRRVRIDHIYSRVMLDWCNANNVKPLGVLMATAQGEIFCSTESLGPVPNLYEVTRATSAWMPDGNFELRAAFEYSTNLIASDTLKSNLYRGGSFSIIAEHVRTEANLAVFAPLVMGFPWLERGDQAVDFDTVFFSKDFYEHYVEDIDEFGRVAEIPERSDGRASLRTLARKFGVSLWRAHSICKSAR
jgi:hypothetical protein